jgi:hypothetical protein
MGTLFYRFVSFGMNLTTNFQLRIVNPELTRNLLLAMSPRKPNTPLIRAVRKEIKAIMGNGE